MEEIHKHTSNDKIKQESPFSSLEKPIRTSHFPESLVIEKPVTCSKFDLVDELKNICSRIPLFQEIKDIPIDIKTIMELCNKKWKKEPPIFKVVGQIDAFVSGKQLKKYDDLRNPIFIVK